MQLDPSPGFTRYEVSNSTVHSECHYCETVFIASKSSMDKIEREHRKACSKGETAEAS